MQTTTLLPLIVLMVLAFGLNLPLGHLRIRSPKYSIRWFTYIHLSIPVIILARTALGFGWGAVPFTLASAVAGQLIGARLRPPESSPQ